MLISIVLCASLEHSNTSLSVKCVVTSLNRAFDLLWNVGSKDKGTCETSNNKSVNCKNNNHCTKRVESRPCKWLNVSSFKKTKQKKHGKLLFSHIHNVRHSEKKCGRIECTLSPDGIRVFGDFHFKTCIRAHRFFRFQSASYIHWIIE